MKKSRLLYGFGAFLGMLILVLDGKTALGSCQEGLSLCLMTVIPSLFPFFVLSNLLIGSLSGRNPPPIRYLCRQLHIPVNAGSLLIPAFLGGYPSGAQSIAQAYRQGQLTKKDAEHMLCFCSNAGPSFLFGMVSLQFTDRHSIWVLWLIHVLSALLVGRLYSNTPDLCQTAAPTSVTVSEAVSIAVRTMAQVCGWILLFRVLIGFLQRWFLWILPSQYQAVIYGLLELSNGCCVLSMIPEESVRFPVCSALLAFGGLCVLMQTVSVSQGLSVRRYLLGKGLQTAFSILLSAVFLMGGWFVFPCILLFILFPVPVKEKSSSIPGKVVV